jgi:secreted PhoX family phosphatase
MTPYDANALAKAAGATPFKRPENGQFRPGSQFTQFFFDETGDTNANTEAGSDFGGFGSVMRLTQSPTSDSGRLAMFYRGDVAHTGLDNVGFLTSDRIVFVEDGGDTLHTQRNALDSAYVFDVGTNYGAPGAPAPARLLAQGRDASATTDSGFGALGGGFQNEGDNEITGFHVSDGDPGPGGILGAKPPRPFDDSSPEPWRVFYTQQHGDNVTWEIVRS